MREHGSIAHAFIALSGVRQRVRQRCFLVLLALGWLVSAPTPCLAQLSRWNLRQSLSAGMMVSSDQIKQLRLDSLAFLPSAHAAYAVLPWLEVRGGLQVGRFLSNKASSGGLSALTGGALLRVDRQKLSPYVALDFGVGRTGDLFRPYFDITVGLDSRVHSRVTIGPVVGLGQLVQWNSKVYTSDARFIWLGISLKEQLGRIKKPAPPPARFDSRESVVVVQQEPPSEPSVDVVELIERALPSAHTERVEMLAPVLFDYNSDKLSPTGVAMLHEVLRTLRSHEEIARVEVEGYADQRGDAEYNRALSERRAQRAVDWLVAHGIAPERLVLSPRGASDFVEPGSDEAAHEQNRRVIFRVVETTGGAAP